MDNPFSDLGNSWSSNLGDLKKEAQSQYDDLTSGPSLLGKFKGKKDEVKKAADEGSIAHLRALIEGQGIRLQKGYYYQVWIFALTDNKMFNDLIDDRKSEDQANMATQVENNRNREWALPGGSRRTFQEVNADFWKRQNEATASAQRSADAQVSKWATMFCKTVNIPGQRLKTQVAKIYGLPYEVPVSMEQDPLWMTFHVDVNHDIPFMINAMLRDRAINANNGPDSSYSPKFLDEHKFDVVINVLNESFIPVKIYQFSNCFFKTVQQINYSQENTGFTDVTAEVWYEYMNVYNTGLRKVLDQQSMDKTIKDLNKISFGPFSYDISSIGGAFTKVASGFK